MPDSISEILVFPAPDKPQQGGKSFLDLHQPVKLNVAMLRDNIKNFLESVNQMLVDVPKLTEPYKLDEIELKVEINGEGNVQLVGGIKVGATGGITFRMKRQSS